jgi:hypothetical protein
MKPRPPVTLRACSGDHLCLAARARRVREAFLYGLSAGAAAERFARDWYAACTSSPP